MCLCITWDANSARSRFWTVTHGRRGWDCDATADNPSPSRCWGTQLRARALAQERAAWALLPLTGANQPPCQFFQFFISIYLLVCHLTAVDFAWLAKRMDPHLPSRAFHKSVGFSFCIWKRCF